MNLNEKREKEKQIVQLMIELYEKKKKVDLTDLKEYAFLRIDRCPFMENKTFCSQCKVHCYNKENREKIKEVMRFSGPRMLFYHPILAIKHMYYTIQAKCKSQQ